MDSLLQPVLVFLWFAVLVGFIGVFIYQFSARVSDREECKRKAIEQFAAWQATSAAAQLQLGAGQCEVVQESETVGRHRGGAIYSYILTRFMRNPAGDYFMFMSTPTRPYVKPVTPEVANVVLKERFVDPRRA